MASATAALTPPTLWASHEWVDDDDEFAAALAELAVAGVRASIRRPGAYPALVACGGVVRGCPRVWHARVTIAWKQDGAWYGATYCGTPGACLHPARGHIVTSPTAAGLADAMGGCDTVDGTDLLALMYAYPDQAGI